MSNAYNQLFPTCNSVTASGRIRTSPQDFQVTELHDFELSGQGEHLWLYVQKINSNTDWVAKQLANACQVASRQVGYAGLKDRHAVTRQWFSIQLPKVDDVEALQSALTDEIEILQADRHNKKLKTGGLKANQFKLMIRDIQGDRQQLEQNIALIRRHGVPNYFGEQRFGHDMGNVDKAAGWFTGSFRPSNRKLKSLLISTARSWIFNHIVAARISSDCWSTPLDGDVFQLAGSRSWFLGATDGSEAKAIAQRLAEQDIHITAALWGEDVVATQGSAAALEQRVAAQWPDMLEGMRQHRVKQDRRAIRLSVNEFEHSWQRDDLQLRFMLPAGGYATTVIREILATRDACALA